MRRPTAKALTQFIWFWMNMLGMSCVCGEEIEVSVMLRCIEAINIAFETRKATNKVITMSNTCRIWQHFWHLLIWQTRIVSHLNSPLTLLFYLLQTTYHNSNGQIFCLNNYWLYSIKWPQQKEFSKYFTTGLESCRLIVAAMSPSKQQDCQVQISHREMICSQHFHNKS